MARRLTMLLASAGRRVELLQSFRQAAAALDVELTVLACDLKPELSSACHLADRRFGVPRCDGADYVDAVMEICRAHDVGLVIPTIDTELMLFAEARDGFAAIGCDVPVSAPALIEIARDKQKTADFFAAAGIPTPRTAPAEEARAAPQQWRWPLMVKPVAGSASRAIRIVNSPDDDVFVAPNEPMVAQELLQGSEYTINIFFDRDGALRCVIPHERLQLRAGEVEKGVTRRMPALAEIAHRIAEVLPSPRGPLCFQAILDVAGNPSVFEINARFGGGYPLAHQAGATFSRWLIEERLGLPSTANDDWRDGLTMLRYDAAVFVEP